MPTHSRYHHTLLRRRLLALASAVSLAVSPGQGKLSTMRYHWAAVAALVAAAFARHGGGAWTTMIPAADAFVVPSPTSASISLAWPPTFGAIPRPARLPSPLPLRSSATDGAVSSLRNATDMDVDVDVDGADVGVGAGDAWIREYFEAGGVAALDDVREGIERQQKKEAGKSGAAPASFGGGRVAADSAMGPDGQGVPVVVPRNLADAIPPRSWPGRHRSGRMGTGTAAQPAPQQSSAGLNAEQARRQLDELNFNASSSGFTADPHSSASYDANVNANGKSSSAVDKPAAPAVPGGQGQGQSHGKRITKRQKEAILDYFRSHGWSEEQTPKDIAGDAALLDLATTLGLSKEQVGRQLANYKKDLRKAAQRADGALCDLMEMLGLTPEQMGRQLLNYKKDLARAATANGQLKGSNAAEKQKQKRPPAIGAAKAKASNTKWAPRDPATATAATAANALSIPYDDAVRLAYDSSDKSLPYDQFRVRYEEALAAAAAVEASEQRQRPIMQTAAPSSPSAGAANASDDSREEEEDAIRPGSRVRFVTGAHAHRGGGTVLSLTEKRVRVRLDGPGIEVTVARGSVRAAGDGEGERRGDGNAAKGEGAAAGTGRASAKASEHASVGPAEKEEVAPKNGKEQPQGWAKAVAGWMDRLASASASSKTGNEDDEKRRDGTTTPRGRSEPVVDGAKPQQKQELSSPRLDVNGAEPRREQPSPRARRDDAASESRAVSSGRADPARAAAADGAAAAPSSARPEATTAEPANAGGSAAGADGTVVRPRRLNLFEDTVVARPRANAAAAPTPPPAPGAGKAAADVAASATASVEVSVPYDAAARLAYESSGESAPFEAFRVRYKAEAAEAVGAKWSRRLEDLKRVATEKEAAKSEAGRSEEKKAKEEETAARAAAEEPEAVAAPAGAEPAKAATSNAVEGAKAVGAKWSKKLAELTRVAKEGSKRAREEEEEKEAAEAQQSEETKAKEGETAARVVMEEGNTAAAPAAANDSNAAKGNDGIDAMRASEMRKELRSYGIPTKSFFEKSQLVDALRKARAEGRTPIDGSRGGVDAAAANGEAAASTGASAASSASTSTTSPHSPDDGGYSPDDGGLTRIQRIKAEMEELKSLDIEELKRELHELGISTARFSQKSEFLWVLAETRVDGGRRPPPGTYGPNGEACDDDGRRQVNGNAYGGTSTSSSWANGAQQGTPNGWAGTANGRRQQEKPRKPSYQDVEWDVCEEAKADVSENTESKAKAVISEAHSEKESKKKKGTSRGERIKAEMEGLKSLSIGELQKELRERGIPTKSFLEKSEFVRALAEARVDGPARRPGAAGAETEGGPSRRDEAFDPTYRDVACTKSAAGDFWMNCGTVIDVDASQQ